MEFCGIDASNGGGFEEFRRFQEKIPDNQIIVFDGLNSDRVKFTGNSISAKKLQLLYDRNKGHYNPITNLKRYMAKKHACNGCDTLYNNSYKCDKV